MSIILPSRRRRDIDRVMQSIKRTIAAKEDMFGVGSPLAFYYIRHTEHGMYELGEMEYAAEMAEMAKRRELPSSPLGSQASALLDKETRQWAQMRLE